MSVPALRPCLTAVVLAAALATTACSVGTSDTGSTSSTAGSPAGSTAGSSTTPTSSGLPIPSVPSVPSVGTGSPTTASTGNSGSTTSALPAGFPLPAGARYLQGADDGHEIAARVSLTDGDAAVSFWRTALPQAGYTVASVQGAVGVYEIRLSGHGFSADDSQIVVQGTTAMIQLDRG